jgi:hypothetical protein
MEIYPIQFEANDDRYIYTITKTNRRGKEGGWIVSRRAVFDAPIPPRTQYLSTENTWIWVIAIEGVPVHKVFNNPHTAFLEAVKIQ